MSNAGGVASCSPAGRLFAAGRCSEVSARAGDSRGAGRVHELHYRALPYGAGWVCPALPLGVGNWGFLAAARVRSGHSLPIGRGAGAANARGAAR